MDRMKTVGLVCLILGIFSSPVGASEGNYLPSYAASPGAIPATPIPTPVAKASPMPAVVISQGRQPEISCTLSVTLPVDTRVPVEAKLMARGKIDGQDASLFRYLFGDGDSATGSGEIRHIYANAGTYQVRVTPVVTGQVETPVCKSKIVVKEGVIVKEDQVETSTAVPTATTSAQAEIQPRTGVSAGYWMSLGSLFLVWLGAAKWYRMHHPQIG